jgi:hypothetical protein
MSAAPSKARLLGARILSVLTVVFLLFDAVGKFAKPQPVIDAFAHLDIPISTAFTIGGILMVCTILYAIPKTSVLGAVLLTGYLGGAVSIHLRAGDPAFPLVFPILIGIMMWGGIYAREPRLHDLIPTRHE